MTILNDAARAAVTGGHIAHLATVNADGSPQLSAIWIGLDGADIVSGHLDDRAKLRNVRRDPRVSLSLETGLINDFGLAEYLTVVGTARVTEGGAPSLLQALARTYLGPDTVFPPGDPASHPPGFVLRIAPLRVGGIGPWR